MLRADRGGVVSITTASHARRSSLELALIADIDKVNIAEIIRLMGGLAALADKRVLFFQRGTMIFFAGAVIFLSSIQSCHALSYLLRLSRS